LLILHIQTHVAAVVDFPLCTLQGCIKDATRAAVAKARGNASMGTGDSQAAVAAYSGAHAEVQVLLA
jgi:predicted negative regulator of RcsB-dependent stress response